MSKKIFTQNIDLQNEKDFFKVPEGYFEKAESRILRKIELLQAAEEGVSIAGIKKSNVFTVPEHAEEELTERIKQAIHAGQKSKSTLAGGVRPLWQPVWIAASIALLLAAIWWQFFNQPVATPEHEPLSEVHTDELIEFITGYSEFDLQHQLSNTGDMEEILAFAYELPIADEHLEEYLLLNTKNLEINDYGE